MELSSTGCRQSEDFNTSPASCHAVCREHPPSAKDAPSACRKAPAEAKNSGMCPPPYSADEGVVAFMIVYVTELVGTQQPTINHGLSSSGAGQGGERRDSANNRKPVKETSFAATPLEAWRSDNLGGENSNEVLPQIPRNWSILGSRHGTPAHDSNNSSLAPTVIAGKKSRRKRKKEICWRAGAKI